MDVPQTYCGHHFMMHVSQIIMLYTNLYSVICKLYINKTGRMFIFLEKTILIYLIYTEITFIINFCPQGHT